MCGHVRLEPGSDLPQRTVAEFARIQRPSATPVRPKFHGFDISRSCSVVLITTFGQGSTMRRLCVFSVTALILCALVWLAPGTASRLSSAETLKAGNVRRWYRGNLHTHSLWSDGDDFLENIALWYRDQRYDFLVFTDHNLLAKNERWIDVDHARSGQKALKRLTKQWPDGIFQRTNDGKTEVRLRTFAEVVDLVGQPGKFLLLQGEEISDTLGKHPLHLCAANLQEAIPPMGGESVVEVLQRNVDAVVAQRDRTRQAMMVHINHPNFGWAITAEQLAQVRGEQFFEVYNGHPSVHNSGDGTHVSVERMWDVANTLRLTEFQLPLMWGLATDDGHSYHHLPSRASEPGRGWVMVLATELTAEALIGALEAGRFYSTSGVTLDEVTSSPQGLRLTIRGEEGVTYRTEFLGTTQGFDRRREPVRDERGKLLPVTQRYSNDVGRVLASVDGLTAEYQFRGDELYVRAQVTSSRPHPNPSEIGDFETAWVQPTLGPARP